MSKYYLAGIIGAILYGVMGGWFWLAGIVTVAAWRHSSSQTYLLALILGILADLNSANLLGRSAVELLIVAMVIYGLRQRFSGSVTGILISALTSIVLVSLFNNWLHL